MCRSPASDASCRNASPAYDNRATKLEVDDAGPEREYQECEIAGDDGEKEERYAEREDDEWGYEIHWIEGWEVEIEVGTGEKADAKDLR